DAEDFWEAAPLDLVHDPTVLACRWLTLQQAAGKQLGPERVADELHRFFRAEGSPGRVLAALAGLLPSAGVPSLLVGCLAAFPGAWPGATDWLGAAGRLLAEVLGAAPRLHAALAVDRKAYDLFLSTAPETRTKALLQECVVHLRETDAPTPLSRQEPATTG